MITRDQSRLLRVLVIDDELQDRFLQKGVGVATHLEIIPVRSWGDAQRLVAQGDLGGADVILIDISFGKDPLIAKAASLSLDSRLLPVGPLLALPFIGRRAVMSCVTYSSHLANEQLHRDPFFLLAMGLITARTDGLSREEPFRSMWLEYTSTGGTLDLKVSQMRKGISNVLDALWEAIDDYRDRLDTMMRDGDVILANRTALDKQLAALFQGPARKARISWDDNQLALTLIGKGWADRIALRSLFADTLRSKQAKALEGWVKKTRAWLADLPESNFERALLVIREQESSAPKDKIFTPDVAALTQKRYGKTLDRSELNALFRLIVLFANAHVNIIDKSFDKEAVFKRLGEKVSHNIYWGWFGERSLARFRTAKAAPMKRVRGPFGHLQPIASGDDKFRRCFLQEDSVISPADRDAIIAYLRAQGLGDDIDLPYRVGTR